MKLKHFLRIFSLLIAALFLTACDPAAYPYNTVDKIQITDGVAILHVSKRCSWGVSCGTFGNADHYFTSEDLGKTWKEIQSPPVEMPAALDNPESALVVGCVPDDLQTCYRISGQPVVEESMDGGKSWYVAWKVPAGRMKFMEKNPQLEPFLRVSPDIIPYDLQILSSGPAYTVIVAMGNQGLVIRSPDGIWERTSLSSHPSSPELAYPLPFYATNFKEINDSLASEINWAFLVTFAFTVILSLQVGRNLNSQVDQKTRNRMRWSLSPFFLGIGAFFLVICLALVSLFDPVLDNRLDSMIDFVLSNGLVTICMLPVIGLFLTLLLVAIVLPNRIGSFQAVFWIVVYALLFFLATWIPLALWAIGVISFYEVAAGLALALGLLVLVMGIRHIRRLGIRSVPPAVETI